MKYVILIAGLFSILPFATQAQEQKIMAVPAQPGYKYLIKAYNTTMYARQSNIVLWPNGMLKSQARNEDYTFLHPSVAFAWRTKRSNMCEVELSSLSLGRSRDVVYAYDSNGQSPVATSGAVVKSSNISIRIERVVNFDKRNRMKIQPMLGFALNPYYTLDKVIPYTSALFPSTDQHYGIRGYVIPRINWNVSNRLVVDVNIPVLVCDLDAHFTNQYVPATGMESYGVADFNAFPRNFSVRLGLGMRL